MRASDVAGPARVAPRVDLQPRHLARPRGQPQALLGGHVGGGDAEAAILEERVGVDGAHGLRVGRRGGQHGQRRLGFQQADDALVLVGVVERIVLGHDLLAGDLAAQQDDGAGQVRGRQLVQGRHHDQAAPLPVSPARRGWAERSNSSPPTVSRAPSPVQRRQSNSGVSVQRPRAASRRARSAVACRLLGVPGGRPAGRQSAAR